MRTNLRRIDTIIVAVEPLKDYVLRLTFDNGEIKCYSMQNKLQGVFSVLQNPAKFQKVFLDEFGNVAWDIDETKDFIGRAGFALSHSSKFDVIVEYFLVNRNYNVFELNEVLFAFDQPLIGA